MESPARRAAAVADPKNAQVRPEADVRKRLSGPALRTFFNIAGGWGLSVAEQRALLGWPAASTYHKYKARDHGALSYDTLTRLSLILGIYKSLQVLYPDQQFADAWMRMPNSNPAFGGGTPLSLAVNTGIDGLYRIRRLLDARRG
jgi:Protein of unknown function (DUF2384)